MLKSGASRSDVCAAVGMSYSTLQAELKRSVDFASKVQVAEAAGKVAMIQLVAKAAGDDWKAAAWLLERKYYEEWAKRDPQSVSFAQFSSAVFSVLASVIRFVPADQHDALKSEVERIIEQTMHNATIRGKRS